MFPPLKPLTAHFCMKIQIISVPALCLTKGQLSIILQEVEDWGENFLC